jgi:hypothetical protein
MMVELKSACWRKSSYSHANGACVELMLVLAPVISMPDPLVGLRASV